MKKQKTFADRAKEIKKRFPRAEWDKIERKDMMKELASLRDEQEEFKTAMGIAEGANQQDAEEQGEPMQQAHGGHFIPGNMGSTYAMGGGVKNYGDGDPLPFEYSNFAKGAGDLSKTASNLQFKQAGTSFLPFGVSGAVSVIGDVMAMRNYDKNMPKSLNLPRVTSQDISLQPQREMLGRNYNTSRNIAMRNSRDMSNPANAYANQMGAMSSLSDSYGSQMGQSYMNEANANAQMRTQTNIRNSELGAQEAQANMQLQAGRADMRGKYIQSLAQTVPSMFRDYRQQVNDTNTTNMMGKDYGQYEQDQPWETPLEKIRRQMFGGQKYILNRDNPNIR